MLKQMIEAYLFAAGIGVAYSDLVNAFSGMFDESEVNDALKSLLTDYSEFGKGVQIIEFDGKFQMQANPQYGEFLADKLRSVKEKQMSRTLLESLAIIAYKQPVTRLEIEEIRGVQSSDYAIQALSELGLVVQSERKDAPGRPWLYVTTDEFLKKFGLTTLEDMPDYEDMMVAIRNNYERFNMQTGSLFRQRDVAASVDDTDDDDGGAEQEFNPITDDISDFVSEGEDEDLENPDFLSDEPDIKKID